MTSRPSPTLPRRLSFQERDLIVAALRAKADTVYNGLRDEYNALADEVRDGGLIGLYYGVRVPLRERADDRKDRT